MHGFMALTASARAAWHACRPYMQCPHRAVSRGHSASIRYSYVVILGGFGCCRVSFQRCRAKQHGADQHQGRDCHPTHVPLRTIRLHGFTGILLHESCTVPNRRKVSCAGGGLHGRVPNRQLQGRPPTNEVLQEKTNPHVLASARHGKCLTLEKVGVILAASQSTRTRRTTKKPMAYPTVTVRYMAQRRGAGPQARRGQACSRSQRYGVECH